MEAKLTWRERRAACKKELAHALATNASLHDVLGRYPERARDPARRVAAFAGTRRGRALWEKVNLAWGITPEVRAAYGKQWAAR